MMNKKPKICVERSVWKSLWMIVCWKATEDVQGIQITAFVDSEYRNQRRSQMTTTMKTLATEAKNWNSTVENLKTRYGPPNVSIAWKVGG
jgi:hypothetical protein